MILDVAVTFENGPLAFDKVRNDKLRKYEKLAEKLAKQYDEATVEAVVVGALESWDPRNDRVCHRLCTKKYTSLMKKLILADILRSSRDIYYQHINPNISQSQPPR